jgi:hypothetical protein
MDVVESGQAQEDLFKRLVTQHGELASTLIRYIFNSYSRNTDEGYSPI